MDDKRSESHLSLRIEQEWSLREHRRRMPLPVRLAAALSTAALLSDTSTAKIGRESSRVKPGSSPPAPDNSLHSTYERKFRLLLEAFEREVDAQSFRPVAADLQQETVTERELRLVNEFEGVPSHEVSFLDGSFGSPRSIERIRARYGRKPSDGNVR
jgi:hypothetical protein